MTNGNLNNKVFDVENLEKIFKTDVINQQFLNIITSDIDDTIVIDEKFQKFLMGNDETLSFKKIIEFNKKNDKQEITNQHYNNYSNIDSIIVNMNKLLKKFTQIFSFMKENIDDIKYKNFTINILDDEKFRRLVDEGEEHEQFIQDISKELNDPTPKEIIELGISSINPKYLYMSAYIHTNSYLSERERKKNINELKDSEHTSDNSISFSSGYEKFKSDFMNTITEELKTIFSDKLKSTEQSGISRGFSRLQRTCAMTRTDLENEFEEARRSMGISNNGTFNNTNPVNKLDRPSIELMNIIRDKMKNLVSKKDFSSIHTTYVYILTLMVKYGFVQRIITENPITNIGINDEIDEVFRCIEFSALNDEDLRLIQCLYLMSFKYDIIKHYRFIMSHRYNRANKGNCAFWGRIMFPLLYYDVNPDAKFYFIYKLIHNLNENYKFHDTKINIMEVHDKNKIPSNFSFNSPNNSSYSIFMQYSFIVGLFAFINYNDIGGNAHVSKPLLPEPYNTYLQELFMNSYLNPSLFINYNRFIKTLLSFVSPISINCTYAQSTNEIKNFGELIPFSKQFQEQYTNLKDFIDDDKYLIHMTAGHAYCVARNKFDDNAMFDAFSNYDTGFNSISEFTRTISDLNKHIFSLAKAFILPKILIKEDNIYKIIDKENINLSNYYFVKHLIQRHIYFKNKKEDIIEQMTLSIHNKLMRTYEITKDDIKKILEAKYDVDFDNYFGSILMLTGNLNIDLINKSINNIKKTVNCIENADIFNYHLNDATDSEIIKTITKGKNKQIKRPILNTYLNLTGKKYKNFLNTYVSSSQINPLVQVVKVDPNFQTNGTLVYKYITSDEVDFVSLTRDKSHIVLEIVQGGMYNIDSSKLVSDDPFKETNNNNNILKYDKTLNDKIFINEYLDKDKGDSLYEVALNKINAYLTDQHIAGNLMLKKYYETMKKNLTSFMKELKKLDDVPLELPNDILRGGRNDVTNYFMIFVKILLFSLVLIIIVVLITRLISKLYYRNDNVANYV